MKKQITGTNYFIDSSGTVTNENGKILSQWVGNTGYLKVKLRINKKPTDFYVHRLVAQAFVANPNNHPMVLHLDDNKANCVWTNLEWGTNRQNTKDGYDRGLYAFKQRSHKIAAVHKKTGITTYYDSVRQLGEELGYNRKTVTSILKGVKKTNNFDHEFYYNMPND